MNTTMIFWITAVSLLSGCSDFAPIKGVPESKRLVIDLVYYDTHDNPYVTPCGAEGENSAGCARNLGTVSVKGEEIEEWMIICPKPDVVGQAELIGFCGHELLHAATGGNWHEGVEYHSGMYVHMDQETQLAPLRQIDATGPGYYEYSQIH